MIAKFLCMSGEEHQKNVSLEVCETENGFDFSIEEEGDMRTWIHAELTTKNVEELVNFLDKRPTTRDSNMIDLLTQQYLQNTFIEQCRSKLAGVDILVSMEVFKVNTLDTVLDIFGIPEDNSVAYYAHQEPGANPPRRETYRDETDPNYYSRDMFYLEWEAVISKIPVFQIEWQPGKGVILVDERKNSIVKGHIQGYLKWLYSKRS